VSVESEIREFLTSRRARVTPERAGLPKWGRHRRVSGLRREEVALLAGISVEYYTRLERGNARGVSESVLEAISQALQLDEAEHAHLLDLVRTANAEPSPRRSSTPQHVRPSVARIVDGMSGIPACVLNGRLDVLYANDLATPCSRLSCATPSARRTSPASRSWTRDRGPYGSIGRRP
jgi:hypothetical protein